MVVEVEVLVLRTVAVFETRGLEVVVGFGTRLAGALEALEDRGTFLDDFTGGATFGEICILFLFAFSNSLGLPGGLFAGRLGVEELGACAPLGADTLFETDAPFGAPAPFRAPAPIGALLTFFVGGIMEKGGSYVTYLLW